MTNQAFKIKRSKHTSIIAREIALTEIIDNDNSAQE